MHLSTVVLCFLALAAPIEGQDKAADWMPWARSKATETKGGLCSSILINKLCTEVQSCSMTGIGYCPSTSATSTPDWFVQTSMQGVGFVQASTFMTALKAGKSTAAAPLVQMKPAGTGFRDYAAPAGKVAYTMSGAISGDLSTVGAYVGVASFVQLGAETTEMHSNKFYAATAAMPAAVDRSTTTGTNKGAPVGPISICTGFIDEKGVCNKGKKLAPDEYKFTIFGYTSGTGYAKYMADLMKKHPALDYMTVGVEYTLNGAGLEIQGAYCDDDPTKTMTSMADKDVDELTIVTNKPTGCGAAPKKPCEKLSFKFAPDYNIGLVPQAADFGKVTVGKETLEVKVRVSQVGLKANELKTKFYVWYMFNIKDFLQPNTYFAYDPDISASKELAVLAATCAAATDCKSQICTAKKCAAGTKAAAAACVEAAECAGALGCVSKKCAAKPVYKAAKKSSAMQLGGSAMAALAAALAAVATSV